MSLSADDIAKLRAHWNNGGRLSDWQIARLLDIAAEQSLPSAVQASSRDAYDLIGPWNALTLHLSEELSDQNRVWRYVHAFAEALAKHHESGRSTQSSIAAWEEMSYGAAARKFAGEGQCVDGCAFIFRHESKGDHTSVYVMPTPAFSIASAIEATDGNG